MPANIGDENRQTQFLVIAPRMVMPFVVCDG